MLGPGACHHERDRPPAAGGGPAAVAAVGCRRRRRRLLPWRRCSAPHACPRAMPRPRSCCARSARRGGAGAAATSRWRASWSLKCRGAATTAACWCSRPPTSPRCARVGRWHMHAAAAPVWRPYAGATGLAGMLQQAHATCRCAHAAAAAPHACHASRPPLQLYPDTLAVTNSWAYAGDHDLAGIEARRCRQLAAHGCSTADPAAPLLLLLLRGLPCRCLQAPSVVPPALLPALLHNRWGATMRRAACSRCTSGGTKRCGRLAG